MSDKPENPSDLVTCDRCFLVIHNLHLEEHGEWHARLNAKISNSSMGALQFFVQLEDV
ncbi:hypothetical protein [Subtercola vilae]|uniref:hypothetical protein n=1 Tax=Subtercola vilae TaxID=2056433 RepID=UPI0013759169|nr:hypothetical protein [Subtercola vilae]